MKSIASIFAALLLGSGLHAAQITGSLTIAGGATLDGPLNTANQVSTWVNPEVESRSGDFITYTAVGQAVTMSQPWTFDPGNAQASLWSVGGFTFNLLSSAIITQSTGFLAVEGQGNIVHANFNSTPGTWRFTTQSPAASGVFSFSASTEAAGVPDGGSTVALMGLALAGIAVLRRRIA